MPIPSATLSQGLDPKVFYRQPVVYDKPLETSYPDSVYKMPLVYGDDSGCQKADATTKGLGRDQEPSAGSSKSSQLATLQHASSDLQAISDKLLEEQCKILGKLKCLHAEVDHLDNSLRKGKSAPKGSAGTSVATSGGSLSGHWLSNTLKSVSGDTEALKHAVLAQELVIFDKLKKLHADVDKFDRITREQSVTTRRVRKHTGQKWDKQELVIAADPNRPPLSLLFAVNYLADFGTVGTSIYVHSSVSGISEMHRNFFSNTSTLRSRADADFLISIVWKEVGADPTLMVNPLKQNPILAEANIIRYILRMINPQYDAPANLAEFASVDKWLTLASRSVIYGSAKERLSAIRQMNGHLGKSMFLLGDEPHLVDAVMISALVQASQPPSSLTGNVKKWYTACSRSDYFSEIVKYLEDCTES